MTQKELNELANLIADKVKKDCAACPFSRMPPEQCEAVFELANGYIIGKKTLWKTIITTLTGLLIALVGYGIIYRIIEFTKK